MGAMYRLKAYFGMVPAEEMAEYADEPPAERYGGRRRDYPGDRWDSRTDHPSDYAAERDPRDVRVADDRGIDHRGIDHRGIDHRGIDHRGAEHYDDDWDRRP